MTTWPLLPWAFPWVLAICDRAWIERALAGIDDPPPYVTSVAIMLGLDIDDLWDHVEGRHGFEPHDEGYRQAVWAAAWCSCRRRPVRPARVRFRPSLQLREAVPWRLA